MKNNVVLYIMSVYSNKRSELTELSRLTLLTLGMTPFSVLLAYRDDHTVSITCWRTTFFLFAFCKAPLLFILLFYVVALETLSVFFPYFQCFGTNIGQFQTDYRKTLDPPLSTVIPKGRFPIRSFFPHLPKRPVPFNYTTRTKFHYWWKWSLPFFFCQPKRMGLQRK